MHIHHLLAGAASFLALTTSALPAADQGSLHPRHPTPRQQFNLCCARIRSIGYQYPDIGFALCPVAMTRIDVPLYQLPPRGLPPTGNKTCTDDDYASPTTTTAARHYYSETPTPVTDAPPDSTAQSLADECKMLDEEAACDCLVPQVAWPEGEGVMPPVGALP